MTIDYEAWNKSGQRIALTNGLYARVKAHSGVDTTPFDEDGHGIVSDWTDRDKRAGERILVKNRRFRRYYDVEATMAIAKRDQWGCADSEGLTPGQVIAKAVEHDFEYLRGWCNGDWQYMGVMVTLHKESDDTELAHDLLWGIKSNGTYWQETAKEMMDNLYAVEIKARHTAWRAALVEARERRYWEERDTVTA